AIPPTAASDTASTLAIHFFMSHPFAPARDVASCAGGVRPLLFPPRASSTPARRNREARGRPVTRPATKGGGPHPATHSDRIALLPVTASRRNKYGPASPRCSSVTRERRCPLKLVDV